MTIVNGFQPLTNATKSSILDVAVVLDTPLVNIMKLKYIREKVYILCNLKFININDFDFSSNLHQLLDILFIVTVYSLTKYNSITITSKGWKTFSSSSLPMQCWLGYVEGNGTICFQMFHPLHQENLNREHESNTRTFFR